jgi:hypothetical protein
LILFDGISSYFSFSNELAKLTFAFCLFPKPTFLKADNFWPRLINVSAQSLRCWSQEKKLIKFFYLEKCFPDEYTLQLLFVGVIGEKFLPTNSGDRFHSSSSFWGTFFRCFQKMFFCLFVCPCPSFLLVLSQFLLLDFFSFYLSCHFFSLFYLFSIYLSFSIFLSHSLFLLSFYRVFLSVSFPYIFLSFSNSSIFLSCFTFYFSLSIFVISSISVALTKEDLF